MHRKVCWCVLVGKNCSAASNITSEFAVIEEILNDACNFTGSKIFFAVRTFLLFCSPLIDALAAVQYFTLGTYFRFENYIEANATL